MKVIFLDIDGTIVDSMDTTQTQVKPSPKTIYAINALREAGHKVFICSGRHKPIVNKEVLDVGYDGYVLANGAFVYYQDKVVFQATFSLEIIEKIKKVAEKYNMVYYLEDEKYGYVNKLSDPRHINFVGSWKVPNLFIEETNFKDKNIHIGMLVFSDFSDYEKAVAELGDDVELVKHNDSKSCDINLKGVHKALGIQKLIEFSDLNMQDTIAFGDGLNDVEMLMTVNEGVAMANACQTLKDLAKHHTLSVKEDGVYHYLLNKGLIKPYND